jgi:mannose-6-phosphate isomerase-like protein (cupin superfamily)
MPVKRWALDDLVWETVTSTKGTFERCRIVVGPQHSYTLVFFRLAGDNWEQREWPYWFDEGVHVVSGRGTLSWHEKPGFGPKETLELGPGDSAFISKGTICDWVRTSEEPWVQYIVTIPDPWVEA